MLCDNLELLASPPSKSKSNEYSSGSSGTFYGVFLLSKSLRRRNGDNIDFLFGDGIAFLGE